MSIRHPNLVKTGLVALIGVLLSTTAYAAEHNVEINKTTVLRLSRPAAAVIIGNPRIADISVHSSDTLLLNGRGYGETNILAFDEFGQTILDDSIQVRAPMSNGAIRVNFVGTGQRTYSCTPFCVPAPVKGDATQFVRDFEGEKIISTNTTATGPTVSNSTNGQPFTPQSSELQR